MQNKTALAPTGSIDRERMARQPWTKGVVAAAAALALWGTALDAHALALGAINVRSALGEPLRAEIEVPDISSQEAATFSASVASPQAFRAAGVDYTPALANARVSLHRRPNGQAYLRVTGERPINEPFLGIVIETASSSGRVVRDYTLLIDPPGRAAPPAVAVTPSQVAAPPVAAPTAAPVVTAPAAPAAPVAAPSAAAQVPAARAPAPSRRAAAEAPRRRAAPTEAASGDGTQVTVQRGDTAYAIASAHAADGVSLDQMLVAMLRANPSAFIGGNVNRMKAGAVLNMPSADQAAATPRQAARRAVAAQTRDFNAYRRGLAQRSGSTRMAAATRSASGGVQPQVQESRPAAPAQDRLTLSRGGAPSGTESKVAQSRQAQEQAARVAELNKNISDLAKLQAASGTAPAASAPTPGIAVPVAPPVKPPAAPAPTPAPSPAPTPAAAPTPAKTASVPVVAAPAPIAPAATAAAAAASAAASSAVTAAVSAASEAASGAAPAADAASAAEAAAKAASAAAAAAAPVASAASAAAPTASSPRIVPAPAPIEEPSFLDSLTENPMLPVAGAGLLALLAGYGIYRSRQRKKQTAQLDSSFIESRLQPDSFFGASGGQRVNTKDGGSSVSGSSFMTYSPSQLDAAGDVDPVAEADVYLAYGRDVQAEEILREALRTHPGRSGIHRKLAEIYAKRRDTRALEAIAVEAYGVTQGQGTDWLAIASLGSELDPINPLYQPGGTPPAAGTAPAPLRHNFGADTEPQSVQALNEAPVSASVPLDFNLDLPSPPPVSIPSAPAAKSHTAAGFTAAAAGAAAAASALATRPATAQPSSAPTPLASHVEPPNLDLDIAFAPPSELREPPAPAPKTPARTPTPPGAANSSLIDFDLGALSDDAGRTQQPDDADEDPLGTKLALAREFHAIGDTEGARALLKEVIAESSGVMRTKAERFLSELG